MTSSTARTANGRRRRTAAACLAAITAAGALLAAAPAAAGAEPVARVADAGDVPAATLTEIDVPGTSALSAAAVDLASYGYTEREFTTQGTAHRYRGASDAAAADATVIDGDWPYSSRVLVRAPQADRFNGTLIVEWTNVTIGLDADFVFAEAHESLLRDGYAIAVVSAQKVGVDRLATWSPERYGDLSVDASNVDPVGGGNIDDCGADPCAGDPLSWDVFTQTAAALIADPGTNAALPGLTVRSVIATGQSQSASRLTAYYNAIQPLENLFDGFVLWDRATAPLRSDLAVPAVSINSEGLSTIYPAFATSEYTRAWEVAGSTHGSLGAADYVDAMFDRDGGLIGPDGQPESFSDWVAPSCEVLPAFSTVPAGQVVAAAFGSVTRWLETGEAAPPSILYDRDAEGTIIRDAEGRIQGGVRLAEFVAPTAELSAFNGSAFPCSVSGSHRAYSDAELLQLYGTHEAYVDAVREATDRALAGGYLLEADAQATIAAAEASTVAVAPVVPTASPTPTSTPTPTATPSPAPAEASLAATGSDGLGLLAGAGALAGAGILVAAALAIGRRNAARSR